jgi:hypothetical protein
LRHKAFEVLRYLAENAGRLVGKQDRAVHSGAAPQARRQ